MDIQEKLYSVVMTGEEVALFSEFQKEFNSKAQKARRAILEFKKGAEHFERHPEWLIEKAKSGKDINATIKHLGRIHNGGGFGKSNVNFLGELEYKQAIRNSAKKYEKEGFKYGVESENKRFNDHYKNKLSKVKKRKHTFIDGDPLRTRDLRDPKKNKLLEPSLSTPVKQETALQTPIKETSENRGGLISGILKRFRR